MNILHPIIVNHASFTNVVQIEVTKVHKVFVVAAFGYFGNEVVPLLFTLFLEVVNIIKSVGQFFVSNSSTSFILLLFSSTKVE
jgi:hypothetical protein